MHGRKNIKVWKLIGKYNDNKPLWKSTRYWQDDIGMDLKEIREDCIGGFQVTVQ